MSLQLPHMLARQNQPSRNLFPILRLAAVSLTICTSLLVFDSICTANETPERLDIDFEHDVAPLLIKRCLECHGELEPAGGLSLNSKKNLNHGGDSGEAIDTENLELSNLLLRVESGEMPPAERGQSRKLPDDEIQIFRQWIAAGANWPAERSLELFETTSDVRAGRDWWALQPIVDYPVPELKVFAQPSNPIDAFVWAKLEKAALRPASKANRQALLRRLSFDLLGLPPTVEQTELFANNPDPAAWEKQIDVFLSQPEYGERWGRYWLDLARYAETSGYERDQEKPYAWKYRDWVVDAFNCDMPYHDFVVDQLAGDQRPGANKQSVIATGFLRLGTWNDEPNQPLDYQYDRLEDLVHTSSSAFLAMTVKCARCHTHKFDPIYQDDYYRMAAAFWPGPIGPRDRELLGGPSKDELGFDDVLGWTDVTESPSPLHVLKNGERDQPLHEIKPAALSLVPSLSEEFQIKERSKAASEVASPARVSTDLRLQLAEWMTHKDNPLTPRVIVNRIWQYHFGEGLVRTPNNFGFLSAPPTHPELLDWLASEFQRSGGSIKHLHRLILTSDTWQQQSNHASFEHHNQIDPGNRLLWHFPRRRLDAEATRDAMLFVSGELDYEVGGESFKPTIANEALEGLSKKSSDWIPSSSNEQKRRSIYMYIKRGLLPPMMTAFDLCDASQPVGKRDVTILPTQALVMLNNQFIHQRSESLASQIANNFSKGEDQVKAAWMRILGREPAESELQAGVDHLVRQSRLFEANDRSAEQREDSGNSKSTTALTLHFRADHVNIDRDTKRVIEAKDLSNQQIEILQNNLEARPTLISSAIAERPAISFDGAGKFLQIKHQPVSDLGFTLFCVVSDRADATNGAGHREIISNWNSDGNIGTSFFLGLTGKNTVRLTDAFSSAGTIEDAARPFILTASVQPNETSVYQNGELIASIPQSLPNRRWDTPWVIGQQGNIQGEFWQGLIAEVRIYAGPMATRQRQFVEQELSEYYQIPVTKPSNRERVKLTPKTLAIASLCHVLFNSNEFVFVD